MPKWSRHFSFLTMTPFKKKMEILQSRTDSKSLGSGTALNAKRQHDLYIIMTILLRCSRHEGEDIRNKGLEAVTNA